MSLELREQLIQRAVVGEKRRGVDVELAAQVAPAAAFGGQGWEHGAARRCAGSTSAEEGEVAVEAFVDGHGVVLVRCGKCLVELCAWRCVRGVQAAEARVDREIVVGRASPRVWWLEGEVVEVEVVVVVLAKGVAEVQLMRRD